jgi:hypothetical protein
MKPEGPFMGIIGLIAFLFGLVRYNSVQSQLVRGFSGSDGTSIMLMVGGGIFMLVGFMAAFAGFDSNTRTDANNDLSNKAGQQPNPHSSFTNNMTNPAPLSEMFCTQCGAKIRAKAIFCSSCGVKIE